MATKKIIIWDDMSQRIHLMEDSIIRVFKQLNIDAEIQINCEVPLLSRNKMIGKIPAFQIGNDLWRLSPNKIVTEEQFLTLFTQLKNKGQL